MSFGSLAVESTIDDHHILLWQLSRALNTMDVKTLCLGVLTERDQTGYEIKQHFEEAFSHFFVAGYGSIYPALADLTKRGLVDCTSVSQEKRPDKKVYCITPLGRAALVDELMKTPPRHKIRSEFLALMYFAHLLPPERLAAIAEDMMSQWDAVLALIGTCTCDESEELSPGMRFVAGYGQAVIGAARQYVDQHRTVLIDDVRKEAVSDEAAD
jgi:DNA-binding PadR family transcriptional regulator